MSIPRSIQKKGRCGSYGRSFDIAELGPLDFDAWVALESRIPDLAADMLPFTIAVGPNKKRFGVLGLVLDVPCNIFLVLFYRSAPWVLRGEGQAYLRNRS